MNSRLIRVGAVMGSSSDWDVMQHAAFALQSLDFGYEARVVSAHRTPELLFDYAKQAAGRGLYCIIAGAGGAAHLPGMLSVAGRWATSPALRQPSTKRSMRR